ncbi:YncE family protein [Flammeovirga kamogawensis]|uniref:YncE family protein n=1 Tax=Flammeovirga kamogawensis TaxID=373891 RepID=A0ABX8GWR0_9BACT|nr:YncE family protein [Flammeovirga kamogawensis]MBB6460656.1 YVTN family beta-propeller protein [Flammeovirga kamogawensis]QWG08011.1 YncE family protein [Flammeovirga kamogawensis]TRX69818.1 YncE family protein [Flammeovirga kamogawensis]
MPYAVKKIVSILIISTLISIIGGYFITLNINSEYLSKQQINNYDSLIYLSSQRFPVDRAPKSLIISPDKATIYTLCLEERSIVEIDQKTKKRKRTLKFKPTHGYGFNYTSKKWVKSLKEKPVEGIFTNNGQYLWVSLHNADAVAVWDINDTTSSSNNFNATILEAKTNSLKKLKLDFLETETTPKSISYSQKKDQIYVTNWHDNSFSVIDISEAKNKWNTIKHIKTEGTPRGIVVDEKNNRIIVGNMGSYSLSIYNLTTLELDTIIKNIISPRDIKLTDNKIIVSQSSKEIISIFNRKSLKKEKIIPTADDPRSIAISNNGNFIFVTCYGSNLLQVFNLNNGNKIGEYQSNGGPVGITLYENSTSIEAWVCNYKYSTVKVFTFELK